MSLRATALLGIAICAAGIALAYARERAALRPAPRPVLTGAAAVVERYECYRCHDAPGKLVPAERRRHCVRCHQAVLAGELDDDYDDAHGLARWKRNIVDLTVVPSLTAIDRRLRRDWLIAFLQRPHDVRPALSATMPRFAMPPRDAVAIADHFIPEDAAGAKAPALGDPTRGRALFEARSCGDCHAFGGSGLAPIDRPQRAEVALAPDLRHTRARMSAAALLAWLADPVAIKPDTLMPPAALTEPERLDMAAFILQAELAPPPSSPPTPTRPPPLQREVRFEEVERRVLRRVCWHCHADPAPVGGDGGPGNTGGFGFAGAGLDLGTFEAVRRGGHRGDVLAPDATGTPRIVAAMLARQVEVAGGEVEGVLGMPLGLPPMKMAEIQLVDAWIAQGAQGPGGGD